MCCGTLDLFQLIDYIYTCVKKKKKKEKSILCMTPNRQDMRKYGAWMYVNDKEGSMLQTWTASFSLTKNSHGIMGGTEVTGMPRTGDTVSVRQSHHNNGCLESNQQSWIY